MSLLTLEERRALKESRIARFYEMEEQFYTVTGFYPAQRLTIHVNLFNIMDIMNCDMDTARGLLKKIGKEVGNEFTPRLRTSDFCYYMYIDEMLIQVFLASLHTDNEPFPPEKTLPALTREEIATERPRKLYEVREDLVDGTMENVETLQMRAMLWEEANPNGEAMYLRKKWVQMVIRAFEVAQILGCHIATAQQMLREVREKDDNPDSKQRRYVSIKKFCAVHNHDEEDVRKHLAELHGADDDDDDDD
jgi:hypothetical protein